MFNLFGSSAAAAAGPAPPASTPTARRPLLRMTVPPASSGSSSATALCADRSHPARVFSAGPDSPLCALQAPAFAASRPLLQEKVVRLAQPPHGRVVVAATAARQILVLCSAGPAPVCARAEVAPGLCGAGITALAACNAGTVPAGGSGVPPTLIIAGTATGAIVVYLYVQSDEAAGGEPAALVPKFTLKKHASAIKALAAEADGSGFFAGGDEKYMTHWRYEFASDGSLLCVCDETIAFAGELRCLCLSADGRQLYYGTGGKDNMLQRRDLQQKRNIGPGVKHHKPLRAIAVSPDGCWVYSGTLEARGIAVTDAATMTRVHDLTDHAGDILALAVSSDGQHLFSAGSPKKGVGDSRIYVWHLKEKGEDVSVGDCIGKEGFGEETVKLAIVRV